MAFLKTLRRNGETNESHTEVRSLVNRMESERSQIEGLLEKAAESAQGLRDLADPMAKMQSDMTTLGERLANIERQLGNVEKILPQITTVQNQADAALRTQRRLETQITTSSTDIERVQSQVEGLHHTVEAAQDLKTRLTDFMQLESPFKSLQEESQGLKSQIAELAGNAGRMREQQDEVSRASKHAAGRIEALEAACQNAWRGVEESEQRLNEVEQDLANVSQLAAGVADAKHQLQMLKALADQVIQRSAALEQQRETLNRAVKQVTQLDDLIQKVDTGLRRQEEQVDTLTTLTTKVDDLQSLYQWVSSRSEEIAAHQKKIDEQERVTRQRLADLRDDMKKGIERFELENRGLEAVSQRITDLRNTLKDCEARLNTLDETSQSIVEVHARADNLSAHVNAVLGDVGRINQEIERVRSLRADLGRVQETVEGMSSSVARIEEARPAVEAVVRDLGTLNRTHEAIKDTLDQMRVGHAEMTRIRESQVGTEAWLKTVQESVSGLQDQVRHLNNMRPTLDSVGKEVERVTDAIESIESRRQFLDEMQTRLADISSLGAQLDERSKGLRSRMEAAEGRFVAVSKQADEAERVVNKISGISNTVDEAEKRLDSVAGTISSLEARSQDLEGLSERARQLGKELDQRQEALQKATVHLEKASTLRQEAADAVQKLDEQKRKLDGALSTAEKRADRLSTLSEQLDERSGSLRFVEKRMAQFEEQLAKWELAELELGRSLEQLAARQATVDTLQADIKHMFEMAERTVQDVRTVAEAQQEIRESKASLEDALDRLRAATTAVGDFDERQRQIEQAEKRLARADALLIDIQSSLETLQSQKALVDHMIEKAGSLTFQTKHAEALIDRLRDEREITNRIRQALEELRNDDRSAMAG